MIQKSEILAVTNEKFLRPDVVEKDYILGWMLAGISAHDDLRESWIFKGGTCLKKCYFDTYRFSEDLDFTLRDPNQINEAFLTRVFAEITEWIYDRSGIEFPAAQQSFDLFKNPRGHLSCQGKISYRGPISPRNLPRVKLDLTADECIVLPPVTMPVFHPYSDETEATFGIQAYAYEEAFGEKVRALAERTRPRDLYDVVNLFRNNRARPASAVLRDVIQKKCDFKEIPMPDLEAILSRRRELQSGWAHMLGHQLPILPDLDGYLNELPVFFEWLYRDETPPVLPAPPSAADDVTLRNRTFLPELRPRARSAIETVRFAASNRLCVDLEYVDVNEHRSTRLIEPYSLRQSKEGNILLVAVRPDNGQVRSYRIDRITNAVVTRQGFEARYEVELTSNLPAPLKAIKSGSKHTCALSLQSTGKPKVRRMSSGPIHVYQCSYCGRKFEKRNRSSKLRQHNDSRGHQCLSRVGRFITTKY